MSAALSNSPDDLARWILIAAQLYANTAEAVRFVMAHVRDRANPDGVAAEIDGLRTRYPSHFIDYEDREESTVYCENRGDGPSARTVDDVTCGECLFAARAYAEGLAAQCAARLDALRAVEGR